LRYLLAGVHYAIAVEFQLAALRSAACHYHGRCVFTLRVDPRCITASVSRLLAMHQSVLLAEVSRVLGIYVLAGGKLAVHLDVALPWWIISTTTECGGQRMLSGCCMMDLSVRGSEHALIAYAYAYVLILSVFAAMDASHCSARPHGACLVLLLFKCSLSMYTVGLESPRGCMECPVCMSGLSRALPHQSGKQLLVRVVCSACRWQCVIAYLVVSGSSMLQSAMHAWCAMAYYVAFSMCDAP
jgi:hypothetical protein